MVFASLSNNKDNNITLDRLSSKVYLTFVKSNDYEFSN